MTQIYKKIIASIAISISFLSFFSGISAQAQYGGTTIILNPSNSTSGSTNPTNTPSSSPTIITPTNRCAGSNTSSSVAGDTVNINLCNIKSGNTVTINNLTTNSLESLELTFTSNIDDGLFQIVKIPDSLVFPNLSGSFINGFELLTTRFDRSAISNIKLTYKVDKSLINRYSNVRAYTSSSPWVSTNLNKVSEDNSFVRFTSSTPVFIQYVISGNLIPVVSNQSLTNNISSSNAQVNLIRTGGFDQIATAMLFLVVFVGIFVINTKRNLLKV